MSHKPGGMLPLLSARPAVTRATLKGAATNFCSRVTATNDLPPQSRNGNIVVIAAELVGPFGTWSTWWTFPCRVWSRPTDSSTWHSMAWCAGMLSGNLATCPRGKMGVNSLPKTVTRQRRDCDLNLGPSAPESSTLTARLLSHPYGHTYCYRYRQSRQRQTALAVCFETGAHRHPAALGSRWLYH